jgi:hypothetical protein
VSDRFTPGAARLAGLIPRALGWRPDDFWNATPAELTSIFASGEAEQSEPLSRNDLERLLERERDG